MAQECRAGARSDRRRVRQALSRQGKRIHVLAREDDVGNVCGGGQESRLERPGQDRASAGGVEGANLTRRSRNARRQPSVAAGAVRIDPRKESEIRRRGYRSRLEKRCQGRGEGDGVADDLQDGATEVAFATTVRLAAAKARAGASRPRRPSR